MKNNKFKNNSYRICPRCRKAYNTYPAISRKDNKTKICPQCGNEEVLIDFLFIHDKDIPRID